LRPTAPSILRLLNYHFTLLLDLDEVTKIFCGSDAGDLKAAMAGP
jgi:hypothetical protein